MSVTGSITCDNECDRLRLGHQQVREEVLAGAVLDELPLTHTIHLARLQWEEEDQRVGGEGQKMSPGRSGL